MGNTAANMGRWEWVEEPNADEFIGFGFTSFNYPDHAMRHCNFEGFLNPLEEDNQDFQFIPVAGNADETKISFRSINFPNHYLRHQGFRVYLHEHDGSDLFDADSTFEFVRPNAEDAGWMDNRQYFSFRSVNYPDHYLRHKNFELWLDERDDSDLYDADTTFALYTVGGTISFKSLNFPEHAMRHKGFEYFNDPAPPDHEGPNEDFEFIVRPGNFNGQGLSFESPNYPGRFLRHRGFRCYLDEYEESELFDMDSTFILNCAPDKSWDGYFSLQSVNYPDKALRHKNFEMWLEDSPMCGNSEGPTEDFCWKIKRSW